MVGIVSLTPSVGWPQTAGMPRRRPPTPVAVLAYPGVQSLDVVGPFEVFRGADVALGEPWYAPTVVSFDGGPVATESGLELGSSPVPGPRTRLDTVVVAGGEGSRVLHDDAAFVADLARLLDRARRVVSVCTGAFLVAATGLAAGKRLATHWAHADGLGRRHGDVTVEPDAIWVRDGALWSSAGVTAGIDVALAVVEADHGPEVAQTVGRHLVMFLRRPGGQSQFAEPTGSAVPARSSVPPSTPDDDPVRRAQRLVLDDPGADHRVETLADAVGMSPRHFTRCFTAAVGVSPARYVAEVRVDAARHTLETSTATVAVVARRCGFGTAETMRRTFLRHLGVAPDDYRRRFSLRP